MKEETSNWTFILRMLYSNDSIIHIYSDSIFHICHIHLAHKLLNFQFSPRNQEPCSPKDLNIPGCLVFFWWGTLSLEQRIICAHLSNVPSFIVANFHANFCRPSFEGVKIFLCLLDLNLILFVFFQTITISHPPKKNKTRLSERPWCYWRSTRRTSFAFLT